MSRPPRAPAKADDEQIKREASPVRSGTTSYRPRAIPQYHRDDGGPEAGSHRREEQWAYEGGGGEPAPNAPIDAPNADPNLVFPVVPIYEPVISAALLYSYPPLTSEDGVICTLQEAEDCKELLLELLGRGVHLDSIAESGVSVPGIIWLCAMLRIQLTWGIVMRACAAHIPFHPLSIMPDE